MTPSVYALRLRERGQLTLPLALRKSLAVKAGDELALVQIEDVLVLSRRETKIPDLSQQFSAMMQEADVSLAKLLQGLEEERELDLEREILMNSIYKLPLVMEPQPEGGYTITCPLLPELITEADDVSEIYPHVADALVAVIELYEDLKRPLPAILRPLAGDAAMWTETLIPVIAP